MQMSWVPLASGMQCVCLIWHSFRLALRNLLCFTQNAQHWLIGDSNPSQCIRQEVWYLQLFLWVLYMTMSVYCNKSPAVTHGKLKGHCCTMTLDYWEYLGKLTAKLMFRLQNQRVGASINTGFKCLSHGEKGNKSIDLTYDYATFAATVVTNDNWDHPKLQ